MTRHLCEARIDVRLSALTHTPDLDFLWCELESRADASMFLGWSWIGCWLASLPAHIPVQVLRAERQGLLVGLALLVVAPSRRLRVALGREAHLHSTGQVEYDGVAIEHNGLLLDRRHADAARAALLRFLCSTQRGWRSVHLPGLSSAQAVTPESLPAGTVMLAQERPCWMVQLQPVRDRGGDYLGLLSARRRAHIRRSTRACEAWGPLSVSVASDIDGALETFERLLQLHRSRRLSLGSASAFDTPHACGFHRRLIATGLPRGEVQLLRVRAGDRDVGCLYSFVHRGRVSFYQSGYDYDLVDHRHSPGMVTLALAIEHNAALGHDCFDFLAGEALYKQSLATSTEPMWWVELQRDGMLLRTENALRQGARRGRDWMRGQAAATAGTAGNLSLVLVGALNEASVII